MRRIGINLLNAKKAEASDGFVKDKDIGDDIAAETGGRDLLSVLVKANTDPNLPEDKRLSDEDVLGRESIII